MGVITDYFRAATDAAIVTALERADGTPLVGGPHPAFDGVEAKGVDPDVVLGRLIAAVRGVGWRVGLTESSPAWPTTPPPGPDGPFDLDDDPWATGPWVLRLGRSVRDTLADLPAADVPAVAARWAAGAEELPHADAEDLRPLVEALSALAHRARTADEDLYCLVCP
ncbi:hypothetical protein [Kitasatospora purpeofusca]|uniref:hypothetical protein n=1 Tax=Kitasatospora purpeofusca TaxID=67352 RepID=UPI0038691611|nr:hypothetical protein OIP63_04130 [Kitasatospora purpeofusca]